MYGGIDPISSSCASSLLSSLELSGTKVYEPQIRARLGTTAHFCEVVVLKLRPGFRCTTWRRCCTEASTRSSSSLISSLLHSHANREWCDEIKLSNLLLPRKSATRGEKERVTLLSKYNPGNHLDYFAFCWPPELQHNASSTPRLRPRGPL